MKDKKQVFLFGPIYTPDICFLWEVIDWRAFGRCPVDSWDDETPVRESDEARNGFQAIVPGGAWAYSPDETRYAGLPPDPDWEDFENGVYTPRVDDAARNLERFTNLDFANDDNFAQLEQYYLSEFERAKAAEIKREEWQAQRKDYIDQFKSEIFLDIRRGNIKAYGSPIDTKLYNAMESEGNYDGPTILGTPESPTLIENDGVDNDVEGFNWENWYENPPACEIPAEAWISDRVDWENSRLLGREINYLWVHLRFDDVLEKYPPALLIDPTYTYSIGDNIAIVGTSMVTTGPRPSKRGRPSFTWDRFHVEVTRRYINGEMPTKKEAAIQELQEWFTRELNENPQRTVISDKLTPYYNLLPPKDGK